MVTNTSSDNNKAKYVNSMVKWWQTHQVTTAKLNTLTVWLNDDKHTKWQWFKYNIYNESSNDNCNNIVTAFMLKTMNNILDNGQVLFLTARNSDFLIKWLYSHFMLISYFQIKNSSCWAKRRRNKLTCALIPMKKH